MDHPWSSLPPAFLSQLNEIIPSDRLSSVLDSFSHERQPSFRINTIKIATAEALRQLQQETISFSRVPWCDEAFLVGDDQKQKLLDSQLYQTGAVYPQSLSSILAALVFDPKPLEEILDMCAAPGSKTSHIAALMENKGAVIANDASRGRVFRLQENLKILGVLNAKTTCLPGEWLWKKYPEMFERVLVDVPCSMEGRFVATEPETYKDWKPAKGKLLSQKQKYLLRSAVACTKSGGIIVYSTCTLNPRENEEVIDWIFKTDDGQISLEDIDVPAGIPVMEGLSEWNGKQFRPELKKTVRIFPSETMEGFFLAKLRKV